MRTDKDDNTYAWKDSQFISFDDVDTIEHKVILFLEFNYFIVFLGLLQNVWLSQRHGISETYFCIQFDTPSFKRVVVNEYDVTIRCINGL